MVSKTIECHVLLALIETTTSVVTFDLWMFQISFDTFALVVNYINKKWQPCHIIVGLFEVHETTRAIMAIQLKALLA
jgi:hypothetical protein